MKAVSFYSTFMLTSLLATVSWKLAENTTPGSETKEFITHSKQHELHTQGLGLFSHGDVQSGPAECCLGNPNIL